MKEYPSTFKAQLLNLAQDRLKFSLKFYYYKAKHGAQLLLKLYWRMQISSTSFKQQSHELTYFSATNAIKTFAVLKPEFSLV